ncbi:FecR family protein [Thalassotalea marina]|uniref:FecR family protein n=1 Tax=Thalassotalea marina TaxID=1673741 RepID=A0A919BFK9_9GAMM|nr:FecR domain-containing protein [Thalassotalea marina]GHF85388.1 hypothetical protein GCM10017161_11180 [Thalassotalea marina]
MPHPTLNDRIRLQASDWISRLNRGLTSEEKPLLIAWINQDPKHHEAIYKVATFFDNIAQLEELNGVFPLQKNRSFWSPRIILYTCAVLLALIATIYSTWLFSISAQEKPSRIFATQIGENRVFALPDGSDVMLNTNSQIEVSFTDKQRLIKLLYGEAQFKVAKNPNRPFTVVTGNKSFTALGTTFTVNKNNNKDMELFVIEGQVLITNSELSLPQLALKMALEKEKFDSADIITDGEQAIIENAIRTRTTRLSNEQMERELAWRQQMLIFNGETIEQVLREVSRYTDIQFEIIDHDIANIRISGVYQANDISGLLTSLQANFNVDAKVNNTKSIQLSKTHKTPKI